MSNSAIYAKRTVFTVPQSKIKRDDTKQKKILSLKVDKTVEAHQLMQKMLDFEAAAKIKGIKPKSNRFKMLTNSERDFIRAELVADYIRLSAGNIGRTPGYFEATLESFCSKICDLEIPSHELMGTYLAAINVMYEDNLVDRLPGLEKSIRKTMIKVLQKCIDKMSSAINKANSENYSTHVKNAATAA